MVVSIVMEVPQNGGFMEKIPFKWMMTGGTTDGKPQVVVYPSHFGAWTICWGNLEGLGMFSNTFKKVEKYMSILKQYQTTCLSF